MDIVVIVLNVQEVLYGFYNLFLINKRFLELCRALSVHRNTFKIYNYKKVTFMHFVNSPNKNTLF